MCALSQTTPARATLTRRAAAGSGTPWQRGSALSQTTPARATLTRRAAAAAAGSGTPWQRGCALSQTTPARAAPAQAPTAPRDHGSGTQRGTGTGTWST